MKRKKSTVPTRIWSFACRAPTVNGTLFDAQLQRAHRYYNTLIEIERDRRNEYREARGGLEDLAPLEAAYQAARAQVDVARLEIKAARSAQRKRVTPPGAAERLKELRATAKAAYATLKAARERLRKDPVLLVASKAINKRAWARIREARGANGLHWGTYLLVEKAADSARKSKDDPGFHRWVGEGRVGVQIHGVLTTTGVFAAASNVLQIDPLPAGTWDSRKARRAAHTMVRLRVGSTGRDPVWVELPVQLHRKLPAGAIKWAWVIVRRVGLDTRYELQITLESESFGRPSTGTGVVAIDLGWRKVPGGIRVGYAVDDSRNERTFVLPAAIPDALAQCDALRGYQDQHFNAARVVLRGYLDGGGAAPDWIAQDVRYMANWRKPAKLAMLVQHWIRDAGAAQALDRLWQTWRQERLAAGLDLMDTYDAVSTWMAGTTEVPAVVVYLAWWLRKNRHLYQWREQQRDKALARRRDIFRCWAAELARTYETIVVEHFDLRVFARNAAPEQKSRDYLHKQRNTAAPGEFRLALVSAAGRRRVKDENAVDSTKQCHLCGMVNEWTDEERKTLTLTCSHCSAQWDQDRNAAINLIGRFRERPGGGGGPGGARDSVDPADPSPIGPWLQEPDATRGTDRSQGGCQGAGVAAE